MIFIQATDVMYYGDPIIMGVDYHISFEDGIPHIIVQKFRNTTFQSARKRATNILKKMGRVTPQDPRHVGGLEFEFELLQPIPVPGNYVAVVKRPRADSAFIGWQMDFHYKDVMEVFGKGDYDPLLHVFLLREVWYKRDFRERLQPLILKQLPIGHDQFVRLERT
jgi:hypothetical protein